ncbi:uncharacterized protein LOC116239657 [Phasianus colchicus]|uniref:uncharacterized protein LOC116239657 n=1 Tax=Phasianus colchicus TaxID=9054 RepID=UPI00129EF492|nr:uncharacterized protein LOC116239657 [Phasianus colchicus]
MGLSWIKHQPLRHRVWLSPQPYPVGSVWDLYGNPNLGGAQKGWDPTLVITPFPSLCLVLVPGLTMGFYLHQPQDLSWMGLCKAMGMGCPPLGTPMGTSSQSVVIGAGLESSTQHWETAAGAGDQQGTHSDTSMLQSPGQQEMHIITFHAYIAALGAARTQTGDFGAGAELIQWDGASCKRCLKIKMLPLEWRNNTEVVVGGDPRGLLSKPCTELHCKGAETFWRPPRATPKGFCSTKKKETRTAWSRGSARVYIWEHTTITRFLCCPPIPQPKPFPIPSPPPTPPEVSLLSPAISAPFSPVLLEI